jgi:hypothetical protein
MRSLEIFHLACVFELRVPELRRTELQQLASINELLWFRHSGDALLGVWGFNGTTACQAALIALVANVVIVPRILAAAR